MNRWLNEYDFFSKANFASFLQSHNISNITQLTPAHPAWQDVQNQLQQIENQWAARTNKTPARVILTSAQATEQRFLKLLGKNVTLQDAEHDYINNVHRIPWNPTVIDAHPFGLVLAMRHESEHGSQSVGAGYATNEHKLIWIERACSAATQDYYWVRLSEMNARMKEAEWCLEMMSTQKGHTSVDDRSAILQMARSLLPKIWDIRLKDDLLFITQAQQKTIKKKDADVDLLKQAFPGIKERDLFYQAGNFVTKEASKIYREHFARLKAVQDKLAQAIATWEHDLPIERKQYEQKQENQKLETYAQQYGLPVLTDVPNGVIAIPIKATYAEETLQNLTEKHHSPAIVIFSNKQSQLIYDQEPVPRPYSTSPSLRMQWQAENALPEIDTPTEIEHGDDERFDD